MTKRNNPSQFTFCTLRIYDVELTEKLAVLFEKTGGTRNAFIGSLVKTGFEAMTNPSANSKGESKAGREAQKKALNEMKDFIRNSSKAEYSALVKLLEKADQVYALLSRIYGIEIMKVGSGAKEAIESGAYDKDPFGSKDGANYGK